MVKKKTEINVGFGITPPKETCDDSHCPFHGKLTLRGRSFTGLIIASKIPKMATIEWEKRRYVRKFERYERRRTHLIVHNPPCINALAGDIVRIMECRPISKTKNFVIIEKVGKEALIKEMLESRERAADRKKAEKKKDEEAEAKTAVPSRSHDHAESKAAEKPTAKKGYDKKEAAEDDSGLLGDEDEPEDDDN
jgi:small subunit ribosomal protein S17